MGNLAKNHPEINAEIDAHAAKTDAKLARDFRKKRRYAYTLTYTAMRAVRRRSGTVWGGVDPDIRAIKRIRRWIRLYAKLMPSQLRRLDYYINPQDYSQENVGDGIDRPERWKAGYDRPFASQDVTWRDMGGCTTMPDPATTSEVYHPEETKPRVKVSEEIA